MRFNESHDAMYSDSELDIYGYNSESPTKRKESNFCINRKGRFTASEVWKLMGKAKNDIFTQTAKTYINRKVAEQLMELDQYQFLPQLDGAAIRWGNKNELAGIFEVEQKLGIRIEKTGSLQETLVHEVLPLAGTPDGLMGSDGLIEVKCPFAPENHVENMKLTADTIASVRMEYHYQIQCLLFLTNRQYCYFVSFDPRIRKEYQLFILQIWRDDRAIAQIETKVKLAAVSLMTLK